jgi:hypothetical protein
MKTAKAVNSPHLFLDLSDTAICENVDMFIAWHL